MSDHLEAMARLWELAVRLNDDMQRGLAVRGLSRSRAQLLWELHRRGPLTQRTLSDALKVSSRNVTGLVDALATTGFVTREPHPTDRRAILVTLTDDGQTAMAAMDAGAREFAGTLFSDLSGDELHAFVHTLDRVLARFRAYEEEKFAPAGDPAPSA